MDSFSFEGPHLEPAWRSTRPWNRYARIVELPRIEDPIVIEAIEAIEATRLQN